MKTSYLIAGLSGSAALLLSSAMRGAPVAESQAIGVAEWWYAAEVNAATTSLPPAEKQARVAAKNQHRVSYILGRDNWQPVRKATDAVAAYVVAFQPAGFVVVSGEDTLQPVLVFNATGSFDLSGSPKTNYLAYYLERSVVEVVERERSLAVRHAAHTNWARISEWMKSGVNPLTTGGSSSGPTTGGPRGETVHLAQRGRHQWVAASI